MANSLFLVELGIGIAQLANPPPVPIRLGEFSRHSTIDFRKAIDAERVDRGFPARRPVSYSHKILLAGLSPSRVRRT